MVKFRDLVEEINGIMCMGCDSEYEVKDVNDINKVDEDYRDIYELKIVLNSDAIGVVEPLLNEMKTMGDIGASRTIKIEDWDEKGRKNIFGFDGDGESYIESIESKLVKKHE